MALVASVWGPGTSTVNGGGFWVLTLIDDGGGSMSTRALYFDADTREVTADRIVVWMRRIDPVTESRH